MIRKLEGGEVFVASDDKLLTEIRGGGAEFTILGMDAADYPELPVWAMPRASPAPARSEVDDRTDPVRHLPERYQAGAHRFPSLM